MLAGITYPLYCACMHKEGGWPREVALDASRPVQGRPNVPPPSLFNHKEN